MNHILVIGGTGNVDRHVVHRVGATGARFRVMSRNPGAAGLPSRADVVRGDLTVPAFYNDTYQYLTGMGAAEI